MRPGTPRRAEPRAREPTFLYVGRLKRYKGVEIALRALALARRRVPTWSSRSPAVATTARARAFGADARPRPGGPVPREVSETEKRRLLRRAWAVVLPVRRKGGHLERGGRGMRDPGARVRQSGPPRVGTARRNGFLVPHGDTRALADRMLALAADPGLVRGWVAAPAPSRSSSPGSGRPGRRKRISTASSRREAEPCASHHRTPLRVPDELRARARERLERLARIAVRPHDGASCSWPTTGADRGSAAAHRPRRGARGYGARRRPPHRPGPRARQGAAAARQGSDSAARRPAPAHAGARAR